jgi:predicted dehydrogenase
LLLDHKSKRSNNVNINTPNRRDFLTTAGKGMLVAGVVASMGMAPLAPPDKEPPDLAIPKSASKKVGFALVGLGDLALTQVLPAFALSQNAAPVALVSGHREKAEKVAAHYQISPKNIYNYENYDSIRDNPDVQVIYVILPNSLHAEYTIRGFQAGKHVLCEKPMAVTEQECQQMIDAGKKANRKLMIGYRLRYEPYNQTMIEMARKQAYGQLKVISAQNMQNVKAPNIRLSKALGGGPLSDVGIYCLNAARYITGEEPIEVSAMQWADPKDERFREVPETIVFTLRFPSGILAHCSGSFSTGRSEGYRVTTSQGYFELNPSFSYSGQRLRIKANNAETELILNPQNHFAKELDHFADCVNGNTEPWTPGKEGLADIRIMTRIQQAADEGRTIKI